MKPWLICFIIISLAGCARFEPRPISPAKTAVELESRSLTNAALKTFLEKNLHRDFTNWPAGSWDFDMLTLAAFYYHPDLAVARAQWNVAQAGIKTAGGRPNPTLSLVPGYDTTHNPGLSPWFPAVSFDVPIETAGKRGKRITAAENISESARLNIATTAWQIRSNLRKSLLDSSTAHQRMMLLQEQVSVQERITGLLEQQAEAGAIAKSELTTRRVALQKARLDLADAASQMAEARARVAGAIGIPLSAFDEATLAFDPLQDFSSPGDLTSADVRRTALQSRSDILGALADYAAAQATLQLEIAKQYPDVHLNPGYQYDQRDNKWSLGITFDLPILNQNQGPIAEAAARREEAAAKFNALQAKALTEIERSVEVFRVSEKNLATLRELAEAQAKQQKSVEAQFKAGEMDRLDLLNAQTESAVAGLVQLDGQLKFQEAAGALEDAVQRPIELMKPPVIEQQQSQAMKENKP
jgi:outer membrane protein TolC